MKLVSPAHAALYQAVPRYEGNPMELQPIAQQMFGVMRKKGGIGIAAPQVGLSLRMFIIATDPRKVRHQSALLCINPELLELKGRLVDGPEGCITWPGQNVRRLRNDRIRVAFTDLAGNRHEGDLAGLAARCFQHELDHLNGITLFGRQQVAA